MTGRSLGRPAGPGAIPTWIAASALALAVLHVGSTAVLSGPIAVFAIPTLVAHLMAVVLAGVVAGGAALVSRGDLDLARYRRICGWYAGGSAAMLGVNLVLIGLYAFPDFGRNLRWAVFSIQLGGLGGLVVGIVEARAIDRAVSSERDAVRADALAAQRDWLDYVNGLLRHEVLNTSNVIEGNAELLLERTDDPEARDRLETVHRNSRELSEVIQNVRGLLDATRGRGELEAVDLETVLRTELSSIEAVRNEVRTDLAAPESVRVVADDLLGRVFANLFANAVEHHDGGTPSIEVTVVPADDRVAVHVADDGPGVPADVRDSLFERDPGDHGLGLYLVRVLAARYGGSVDLTETGPDGSVFTVTLRRAGDADDLPAPTMAVDVGVPFEGDEPEGPPRGTPGSD